MMHCTKANRFIQLYIDEQLPFERMRELESHLTDCASCREELRIQQSIVATFQQMEMVAEPEDLTASIMQRIAQSERKRQYQQAQQVIRETEQALELKPSWREMLSAVVAATFAMVILLLFDPSLRTLLPSFQGHDVISLFFINLWDTVLRIDTNTLLFCVWIIGTILGVWITLVLVGQEMRSSWYRSVVKRLPVW